MEESSGEEPVKQEAFESFSSKVVHIPSEDLFIEINKHWTHGGHPFDKMSLNDISKLEQWEENAKTSQFYKNAIYVWTDLDVRKQDCAKQNHLNYQVIY